MKNLEQICNKIQCTKQGHDKKPIIQFCMNKQCKDNNLMCIKCINEHDKHQTFIIKSQELDQLIIKRNPNNKYSQELFDSFMKYKSLLLKKLEIMENNLQNALTKLNKNSFLEDFNNKLQQQLKYQDIQQLITNLNDQYSYDIIQRNLIFVNQDQLQNEFKKQVLQIINILTTLNGKQEIQNKETNNLDTNTNQQKKYIKRYDNIAKDQDQTFTIKQIRANKLQIATFSPIQSCELIGIAIPQLYKSKDLDYSNNSIQATISLHLGLDLTMRQFEFSHKIEHLSQEKYQHCYLIRFPISLRLQQGQLYTISMSIKEAQLLTFSFSNKSTNQYINFEYPKSTQYKVPKQFIDIDDYGYFPYFLIQ